VKIRDRASFQPPRSDPDHKWWHEIVDNHLFASFAPRTAGQKTALIRPLLMHAFRCPVSPNFRDQRSSVGLRLRSSRLALRDAFCGFLYERPRSTTTAGARTWDRTSRRTTARWKLDKRCAHRADGAPGSVRRRFRRSETLCGQGQDRTVDLPLFRSTAPSAVQTCKNGRHRQAKPR